MTDQDKKSIIETLLNEGYKPINNISYQKSEDKNKLVYIASFFGKFFIIECYKNGNKNSHLAHNELQRIKKTIKGGK